MKVSAEIDNEMRKASALDLLTGADAIAAYLGWPIRRVYLYRRRLPIKNLGKLLVARKSELEKQLSSLDATWMQHD